MVILHFTFYIFKDLSLWCENKSIFNIWSDICSLLTAEEQPNVQAALEDLSHLSLEKLITQTLYNTT